MNAQEFNNQLQYWNSTLRKRSEGRSETPTRRSNKGVRKKSKQFRRNSGLTTFHSKGK